MPRRAEESSSDVACLLRPCIKQFCEKWCYRQRLESSVFKRNATAWTRFWRLHTGTTFLMHRALQHKVTASMSTCVTFRHLHSPPALLVGSCKARIAPYNQCPLPPRYYSSLLQLRHLCLLLQDSSGAPKSLWSSISCMDANMLGAEAPQAHACAGDQALQMPRHQQCCMLLPSDRS